MPLPEAVAFENPPLKRTFGAQVAPPSVVSALQWRLTSNHVDRDLPLESVLGR
jgi:hypothetical protein